MAEVFGFHGIRRSITERRMPVVGVVVGKPAVECREERDRAGPLAQPHQLLLERPEEALGVGVTLGVVVAREWSCPRQTGQVASWCALMKSRGERIPRARCGCISL